MGAVEIGRKAFGRCLDLLLDERRERGSGATARCLKSGGEATAVTRLEQRPAQAILLMLAGVFFFASMDVAFFGWLEDLIGPLLLRRKSRA